MTATLAAAPPSVSHPAAARRVVAGLLVVAAAIHVWVAPEHLAETLPAGVFFLVLAAVQLGLAGLFLVRATTSWVSVAVWVQAGTVVLYAWAHSTGLPFLPEGHGHEEHADHAVGGVGDGVPALPAAAVEPPDLLGISCLVVEVLAVLLLVAMLPPRLRSITTNALLSLTVLGVVAWWAGLGA